MAWGLAIFLSSLSDHAVFLRDEGAAFTVTMREDLKSLKGRLANVAPSTGDVDLVPPWMESPNKTHPSAVKHWVDHEQLKQDYENLKKWRREHRNGGQEEPAFTVRDQRAHRYRVYNVMTSPGKQWSGYNEFSATVQEHLANQAGWEVLLDVYARNQAASDEELDGMLTTLALRNKDKRWYNPPGFLYPGMSEGPTMRFLRSNGIPIGAKRLPEWNSAKRGDRSLFELYLAYVGFFAVAQVAEAKDRRFVLVPCPAEVELPRGLNYLRDVQIVYMEPDDRFVVQASLGYGRAALNHWKEFAERWGVGSLGLHGVHVNIYWKPNNFTFSLQRATFAPLPTWLEAAAMKGFSEATDLLKRHVKKLYALRDETDPAARKGVEKYLLSLNGEVKAWLESVREWFRAGLRAERKDGVMSLWKAEDIRKVVDLLDRAGRLAAILDSESFRNVATAIHDATVRAHYARKREKKGFPPEYDLMAELASAADRGTEEFLQALFEFVSRYNDVTMRMNERVDKEEHRPMLREKDVDQVAKWVLEDRTGLLPAALLAYGSSLYGKEEPDVPAEGAVEEAVSAEE